MSISRIGRVSSSSDLVLGSAKRASFLNRNEMPEFQGDKKLPRKNFSSPEKNRGYGITRFIEEHQILFLSVLASTRPSVFGRPLRLAGTRALPGDKNAHFIEIHLLPTLLGSWGISKASMPAICYQKRHRSAVSASRQGLGLSALFKLIHMSFVTQFIFILAGYTLGAKRCSVKRLSNCACLCLLSFVADQVRLPGA